MPDPLFREVPKAVEPHEIAEVVAGYGVVAEHCMAGGFDGIELQCSHSSIVRGFLSPATNQRTDSYGGSAENRFRIVRRVIEAVRAAVPPSMVVGIRVNGDDGAGENALRNADWVAVARSIAHPYVRAPVLAQGAWALAATGHIDQAAAAADEAKAAVRAMSLRIMRVRTLT
nr:hypothetical protein [Micromonospora sp. DSM 115978]